LQSVIVTVLQMTCTSPNLTYDRKLMQTLLRIESTSHDRTKIIQTQCWCTLKGFVIVFFAFRQLFTCILSYFMQLVGLLRIKRRIHL